jgi:membrane fusion protein (multidrug efflux system)
VTGTFLKLRPPAASLFLVVAGTACTKPAPQAPPPQEVAYITVAPRTVDEPFEFTAEVQASRRIEVRTPVSGIIESRPFTEGSQVRVGDVLYRIEKTVYEAAFRSAEARMQNAQKSLARLEPLLADHAVAQKDVDDAETELLQARATYDEAKKNLDDCTVRAEIAGRVGEAKLEVGSRVSGSADLLTTIDVLNPVYVNFQPSAQQLLKWKRDPKASRLLAPGGAVKVQAILSDGAPAPVTGRISFVDPVVDAATGTQQFRALFPNAEQLLLPGQFVRVRLNGLSRENAVVVPQRAVIQQMGRQIVYLVGAGDSVSTREVQGNAWSGDQWLIETGLQPGDRVIVDGVQKVGPGRVVRAVALADSAAPAATLGAGAPTPAGR